MLLLPTKHWSIYVLWPLLLHFSLWCCFRLILIIWGKQCKDIIRVFWGLSHYVWQADIRDPVTQWQGVELHWSCPYWFLESNLWITHTSYQVSGISNNLFKVEEDPPLLLYQKKTWWYFGWLTLMVPGTVLNTTSLNKTTCCWFICCNSFHAQVMAGFLFLMLGFNLGWTPHCCWWYTLGSISISESDSFEFTVLLWEESLRCLCCFSTTSISFRLICQITASLEAFCSSF